MRRHWSSYSVLAMTLQWGAGPLAARPPGVWKCGHPARHQVCVPQGYLGKPGGGVPPPTTVLHKAKFLRRAEGIFSLKNRRLRKCRKIWLQGRRTPTHGVSGFPAQPWHPPPPRQLSRAELAAHREGVTVKHPIIQKANTVKRSDPSSISNRHSSLLHLLTNELVPCKAADLSP